MSTTKVRSKQFHTQSLRLGTCCRHQRFYKDAGFWFQNKYLRNGNDKQNITTEEK